MELEVKNIGYTYKSKRLLKKISFQVTSSDIIGVFGEGASLLLEILDLEKKYIGQIYVNGELVTSKNKRLMQQKIALISRKTGFFKTHVQEEMAYICDIHDYTHPEFLKRMEDSLKFVGLPTTYLSRSIDSLSASEKILVLFACNLILNPQIILIDDLFKELDYRNQKMILKLLRRLRDRKNKLIILASSDVDFLYEYTDYVFILKDKTLLQSGKSGSLFKNIKFLTENGLPIPSLVQFTSLAKNKKVRLSYHRDILDLIKDVYKHV